MKVLITLLLVLFVFIPLSLADDIRDIKGPVDFPYYNFYLYALLAAVLGGALFFLIRYLINRSKAQKAILPPPRPPWEIAFERLQELKTQNFPNDDQHKEYCTVLSDIVRRYLENRFHLRAPEMTTPEFLDHLNQTQALRANLKELLRDFFNFSDMVKFAKYGPKEEEIEQGYDSAWKLVSETQETETVLNQSTE